VKVNQVVSQIIGSRYSGRNVLRNEYNYMCWEVRVGDKRKCDGSKVH